MASAAALLLSRGRIDTDRHEGHAASFRPNRHRMILGRSIRRRASCCPMGRRRRCLPRELQRLYRGTPRLRPSSITTVCWSSLQRLPPRTVCHACPWADASTLHPAGSNYRRRAADKGHRAAAVAADFAGAGPPMAQRRVAGAIVRSALAIAITAALLSGWWYARNGVLYHEWLPMTAFQQSFEGTTKAVDVVSGKVDLHSNT